MIGLTPPVVAFAIVSVSQLDKVHILDASSVDSEALACHLVWQEKIIIRIATLALAHELGQDVGGHKVATVRLGCLNDLSGATHIYRPVKF